MKDELIKKKSWNQFRNTGLLLIVNQILHVFGWSLVISIKDGQIEEVYPARVKFRGFDNKNTTEAYQKVTQYLKNNIEELHNETKD